MSFRLKVAPYLFQKAMIKIYEPILYSALIYIDDILLFFPNEESHLKFLQRFIELTKQYGVMLSPSKMHVGTTEIEFLGMHFMVGQYQPGPYFTSELQKFPDHDLFFKRIR